MRILPRPFGQVLSDALNSVARVWQPLFLTSLMVFLPTGVATLALFHFSGATEFLDLVFGNPAYLQTLPANLFWDLAQPFVLATAGALLIQAIATVYLYLFCHRLVSADLKNARIGVSEGRKDALQRMGSGLLAALIAAGLVIGLLFVGIFFWSVPLASVGTPNPTSSLIALILLTALIAPAIWVGVSVSMTTPVISIEGRGALGSLRRSRSLVANRWWPSLGFLLMVGLLGSIATELIQLVAIPLSLVGGVSTGLTIVSLIGLAAQGPIVATMGAAFTHWYLDLRARREPLFLDQL